MKNNAMNPMAQVSEFHIAFGHPIAHHPGVPVPELRRLREKLITEEYQEFMEASSSLQDVVEVADALADLIYVIAGAALVWGIPLDAVFNTVHENNMSKLGPDGKPLYRSDGKVIKPENWQPPNVLGILNDFGYEE